MKAVTRKSLRLCSWCSSRNKLKYARKSSLKSTPCTICGGSLDSLPGLASEAVSSLKGYQFQTFLVGSSVSPDLVDAEDEFRSKYKIRGRQSIKGQVSRYVGSLISKKTRRKVEHSRPDITVLVSVPGNSVVVNPRSIWLNASYKKTKRGIAQRSSQCKVCNGVGCSVCNYKGSTSETLQGMSDNFFSELFGADTCNFIWVGNEDDQSLVGGNGRPFFIEIVKPKKRPAPNIGRARSNGVSVPRRVTLNGIVLNKISLMQSKPSDIPQLDLKCRVYLKWKSPNDVLARDRLLSIGNDIEKEFSNRTVRIKLSKRYKSINRKIKYISLQLPGDGAASDLACTIEIGLEGGVPMRKFVMGNDEVYPNLSPFLANFIMDPLRPFDIIDVDIRGRDGSDLKKSVSAKSEDIAIAS